jgi:hypothetical protein
MGCKQIDSKKPQENFDKKTMKDIDSNAVKSSLIPFGEIKHNDLISEYVKINLVGKPLYDPFELVILDIYSKKISIDSTISNHKLKSFNILSTFCNGQNKLFISGGDFEASNNFCMIDLINKNIDFQVMKNPRRGHSMIYIPNEFIFIVGGISTKSVEIFNINKKEFNSSDHSTLNEIRLEPALCLIDSTFLYAFTGFNKDTKKTFERVNLRTNSSNWELINVNLEKNVTFNKNFFAVSYYKHNDVIFLGGIDTESNSSINKKSYVFNFKTNFLSYESERHMSEEYTEKFFFPVYEVNNLTENSSQNFQNITSLLFPNFNKNDYKVSIFNNLNLTEVKFEIEK